MLKKCRRCTAADMSGSHVRHNMFERLSPSIERQAMVLSPVILKETTCDGGNTELGI
jgi:hypothetical protein